MPGMAARAARVPCAPWFGIHAVSRPLAQTAAAARVSIGAGATRWLTMVRETTTSQPSNRAAARVDASPKLAATLPPAAGNSRPVWPAAVVRKRGSSVRKTLVPSMLTLPILPGRDAGGQSRWSKAAGATADDEAETEDRVPLLR